MTDIAGLIETEYGRMIVPAFDINQTEALVNTKRGVHHDRVMLLAALLDQAPPGKVYVDAGANIGAFAVPLVKHVDDSGWVHCFEPQPVLCNMLAGSMALTQRQNVRVHNVALGAENGTIELPQFDYAIRCNFGSIEFGPHQQEPMGQERGNDPAKVELVTMRTLDSYNLPRLDVFKIDVQRMEIPLLAGARETLIRCKPVLFMEWIDNPRDVLLQALDQHDYYMKQEVGDDWLCYPKETA